MKRINKKDFEKAQQLSNNIFIDYDEFKSIKKELDIYDFKRMTIDDLQHWINSNYTLFVEDKQEFLRRKTHLQKIAIITRLYFND